MIVKCQRSLSTTHEYRQMLFYNKSRDYMGQFDLTEDWDQLFGKKNTLGNAKFYAEVKWPDTTRPPVFVKKVPAQNW